MHKGGLKIISLDSHVCRKREKGKEKWISMGRKKGRENGKNKTKKKEKKKEKEIRKRRN